MPRSRSRLYRDPKSPFWYGVWTDHRGGTHRQSTGCRDHGSASAWLATRELERVRGEAGIPVAQPVPLKLALAEYCAEHEGIWSCGWTTAVDGFFANRVRPHFDSDRVVSSITRADVERFRAGEVGRAVRGGRPATNATVNRMMAALAAFGRWCLVDGRNYHTANPWAGHSPLPEDQTPVPALSDAQVQTLLEVLDHPPSYATRGGRSARGREFRAPWRAIVEFARETGLRRGELGRLAIADVDRKNRLLSVTSTRARGLTKGRKMRPVPLSSRALELLDLLPKRADGLVLGPIPDSRRAFRTAAKAAGLERVWLHLFRHLFASRLAERGAGRAELRDAGGWSSGRMADRYTHARMDRLRALVDGESSVPSLPQGSVNPRNHEGQLDGESR